MFHLTPDDLDSESEDDSDAPELAAPAATPRISWVIDSGSSFDLIDELALEQRELDKVKTAKKPFHMLTANGAVTVDREVSLRIDKLNEKADFVVMENAPLVLLFGKRCLEQGCGFHWYPGAQRVLVTPKGRKITLGLEGYVPVLPMTAAQREAKAASSSAASSSTMGPALATTLTWPPRLRTTRPSQPCSACSSP